MITHDSGGAVSDDSPSMSANAMPHVRRAFMQVVDVQLLPKQERPQEFKLLRPITVA